MPEELIIKRLDEKIHELKTQLANQAALLRRAEEGFNKLLADKELEIISHMSPNCGNDHYFCCLCGVEAETERLIEHKAGCLYMEITNLLLELQEAQEKTNV